MNFIKPLMVVFLAVVFFITAWMFAKRNPQPRNEAGTKTGFQTVSVAKAQELTQDPATFVLDVHTPEQTHIPGTTAFIPFDDIGGNLSKLPKDKQVPILVYCRSGSMSKKAADELVGLGYKNVYDLDGGIKAYREHNTEVVITPDSQDLGEVIYGDVVTTTFNLTNFTPLPLKITRVSTSCGCTKAQIEDKEVEAYGETIIDVSFDPAVHKDDTDLGELTRTIYIETDNPNFSDLESTITATVIKEP